MKSRCYYCRRKGGHGHGGGFKHYGGGHHGHHGGYGHHVGYGKHHGNFFNGAAPFYFFPFDFLGGYGYNSDYWY